MRCLNCGAEIDDESYMCPYCNKRIIDSIRKRRIEDISVYNRKMVIDEAFGFKINHDFHKLKLKELERYYNSLEKEYDHFGAQLQAERQKEICDHIESVYEKIQEAYPLRKGIQNPPEIKNKHFENNRELLNFLLDSCVPPQIHAAAFKLRSLSERSLRDHYCFEYGEFDMPGGYKRKGFKLTYLEMFNRITKGNITDAKKLEKYHMYLNLFIHESNENDRRIRSIFKKSEAITIFLKKVTQLHDKYSLL